MNELLYFSFSDLMIRVEYNPEGNILKYASHRKVIFSERVIVEQYLLSNFALKTEYYRREPALFMYLGKDEQLVRDLNLFHLKHALQNMVAREKDIHEKVSDLISHSMTNYYFERIGEAIRALRFEIDNHRRPEVIDNNRFQMSELIKAYNVYASQKINLAEIIPEELKSYLGV
ncbi:hypothetical protein L0128_14915 [candidate division KSB1 bacterium]|nr:hypothetical protein [candidate division KSB1 bacterium]